VWPVTGKPITTPYGRRGKSWSCNANSSGGIHTGADIAAPAGTPVLAMRPGKVRHVNFGSSFGTKQVAITGPDGTVDFYAHMRSRVSAGTKVDAGDKIGEVGSEGNATGPHLHLERHANTGGWSCSNHRDPAASLAYVGPGEVYLSKLRYGQRDSDSVARLQDALNRHPLTGGRTLPVTGNYLDQTDAEVRLCQQQHGYGNDPAGASYVGPRQASHIFAGTGNRIIDDLDDTPPPVDPPDDGGSIGLPGGTEYWYSGKPGDVMAVANGYSKLAGVPARAPKRDGLELWMLYANVKPKFKSGKDSGEVRVRIVRAPHKGKPADPSAYQTYTVNRGALIGGTLLITHVWFQSGEAGRAQHWEIRASAGLAGAEVGTRYAKALFVPWATAATIEAMTRGPWQFLRALLGRIPAIGRLYR
jgi:hypothetical protein